MLIYGAISSRLIGTTGLELLKPKQKINLGFNFSSFQKFPSKFSNKNKQNIQTKYNHIISININIIILILAINNI